MKLYSKRKKDNKQMVKKKNRYTSIVYELVPDCRIPDCRVHFAEFHIADFC